MATNTAPAPAPTHSRFSPSATRRWIQCAASIPLTETLRQQGRLPERDPDNIHSLRGTLIHAMVASAMERNLTGADPAAIIDSHAANDPVFAGLLETADEEIDRSDAVRTADRMLVAMRGLLDDLHRRDPSMRIKSDHVEEWVGIKQPIETGGTPDYARVRVRDSDGFHELSILDIKTGTWKVRATRNPQLMTYAYLVANREFPDGNWDPSTRIILCILQPNLDSGIVHTDSWETTLGEVKDFVEGEVVKAIQAAQVPEPTYNPGHEQCRFCPAKPFCPALARLAEQLVAERLAMKTMSDDEIVNFYDRLELLKSVRQTIETQVREGRSIAGFEVKPGYKRGKWAEVGTAGMEKFLAESGLDRDDFIERYTDTVPLAPSRFRKEEPEAYKVAVESGAITFVESAPRVTRSTPTFSDEDLATLTGAGQ